MKTNYPKIIALSLLGAAFGQGDEEDYNIVLLQRQIQTGNIHQTPVSARGQRASLAPVPEGGSEFELWALKKKGGKDPETLVDTEIVSAYLPDGELSITTPDPYTGTMPRTRIDKGFTLNYEVRGLYTGGANAPDAAKQVLLDHNVANYADGYISGSEGNEDLISGFAGSLGDLLDSLMSAEADFDQQMIGLNGPNQVVFAAGNIGQGNYYEDAGVETFRLYALPDGNIAKTQLSEAQVQVWPMSQATIKGVAPDESYSVVPQVEIDLKALYPDSTTWVQIYKGPPVLGTIGTSLNESTIVVDDVVPRSSRLVFRDLNRVMDEEGVWTLEVLTRTPFGVERLAHKSLAVGRTIKMNAQINSLGN